MQEIIALLAPALVALGFYSHLNRDNLSIRKLFFNLGVFALLVNLCTYLVIIFVLGQDGVYFEHKSLVGYLIIAGIFAFIIPLLVNLVENSVSIEVKQDVKR